MRVEWIDRDTEAFRTLHAHVFLDADDVDTHVEAAYERLARILKCDAETARERARVMLTDSEIERFMAESVMARVADDLDADLDVPTMYAPACEHRDPCREGEPFSFAVKYLLVPAMELDFERPIVLAEDDDENARIDAALSARIHGEIPQAHLKLQIDAVRTEFRAELKRRGVTSKEYRMQRRLKPQELVDELHDRACERVKRDTALELAFKASESKPDALEGRMNGLLVIQAKGTSQSEDLRRDMKDAGRLCLLRQQARRDIGLDWIKRSVVMKEGAAQPE